MSYFLVVRRSFTAPFLIVFFRHICVSSANACFVVWAELGSPSAFALGLRRGVRLNLGLSRISGWGAGGGSWGVGRSRGDWMSGGVILGVCVQHPLQSFSKRLSGRWGEGGVGGRGGGCAELLTTRECPSCSTPEGTKTY